MNLSTTQLFMVIFICIFILIVALSIIFKRKISEWDGRLGRYFKKKFSKEDEDNRFISSDMCFCSYHVRTSSNDFVTEESSFQAAAPTINLALETIFHLKSLSEGDYEKEGGKKK